jgi:hypothetical protein
VFKALLEEKLAIEEPFFSSPAEVIFTPLSSYFSSQLWSKHTIQMQRQLPRREDEAIAKTAWPDTIDIF